MHSNKTSTLYQQSGLRDAWLISIPKFCISSKEKHGDGFKISYYNCNRSGKHLAKGTGRRRIKSQGSSKIGAHCTSTIQLIENCDAGLYQVNFCKTHYGHEMQLGHIRISNKDKATIACKRKLGIEKERILRDIREGIGKVKYVM